MSGAVIQAAILVAAIAAALNDGKPRTKTKWFRWASEVIQPSRDEPLKEARKWHHRPIWHRAAVRASAVIVVAETGEGLLAARGPTIALASAGLLTGAGIGGYRGWRYVSQWEHRRHRVAPARDEIGEIVGVTPWQMTARPDGSRIELPLPYGIHLSAPQWDAVTITVNQHFPAAEPLHCDRSAARGRRPVAHFARYEPPPAKAIPADLLPAIEKAKEHEIVFGLAGGGVPFIRSLDQDTPHIGFSMKSGGGKTTCAMGAGAQVLYHGGIVFVLDNKVLSHMWGDDLDNVVYAYTPQMIHEALLWLAWDEWRESELTYRKKLGRAHADVNGNVTIDLGPRILILAEELNSTQRMLKRYWRQIGGKGPSPASEALDELSNAGRQFGMHLLYIGQRLSAKAVSGNGTADARENLGLIVFYNPSRGTWDLLTDGHEKPPDSTVKGRYQIVDASGVTAVQGAKWTGREARQLATSGKRAEPHRDLPFTRHVGPAVVPTPLAQGPAEQGLVVRQTPLPARPEGSLTIREALDAGMFGAVNLEALRQRVARRQLTHIGWDGASKLYDRDDLRELIR